jgi:metal-responsive CopG/Arc/MetJ family transcriptional regulator
MHAILDYDASMGRPPLNIKSTNIRLPEGLGERIDKLVGPQRRAAFIREVLEREVERLEKLEGRSIRSS